MDFLHKFLSILELTIQYCAELNTVPRAEAKRNSMIIFNKQFSIGLGYQLLLCSMDISRRKSAQHPVFDNRSVLTCCH